MKTHLDLVIHGEIVAYQRYALGEREQTPSRMLEHSIAKGSAVTRWETDKYADITVPRLDQSRVSGEDQWSFRQLRAIRANLIKDKRLCPDCRTRSVIGLW